MTSIVHTAGAALLNRLDPEMAHGLTLRLLKLGLGPVDPVWNDPMLKVHAFDREFPNPIGLAAGFDKNAEVADAMLAMGFGFVETGTVTPRSQPGNPKPRLFRLRRDRALINRMGFNNEGLEPFARRLKDRRDRGAPGIVGANLGANKNADDRIADYVTGLRRLYGLADYFTINISSPNTPGLRSLQDGAVFRELVGKLVVVRDALVSNGTAPAPLLIKVAPDLTEEEMAHIAEVALTTDIDGLIVSNTSVGLRDRLKHPRRNELGGLSGRPLFPLSTRVLRKFYQLTDGKVTLIGVGGVSSARLAYDKIKAGASLVQLYTGMTYEGPALVPRIKKDLSGMLKADGFSSLAEAIGSSAKPNMAVHEQDFEEEEEPADSIASTSD